MDDIENTHQYTTSSFVHHFKSIGQFKIKLQTGNAKFGQNWRFFCPVWPRNLTDDLEKQQGIPSVLHQALCIISKPWVDSKWGYSPETPNSGQNRQCFVPCDLEIWRMTLKNNRAPLLCSFKLCASFHSHQWIQTRVEVQKRPICVKIDVVLFRVTLKFDRWPWKTIGYLFYATSSCVHHFTAIGEFKLELQSGNAQFG